jgi:glutamate carboxypeptidase
MNPKALLAAAEARLPQFEAGLRTLVQQESPTESPALVNAAVDLVQTLAAPLNPRTKLHKQKLFGNLLELRFGPTRPRRQPILLLGHLDTVWPAGTLAGMPFRADPERFHGPGVLDMKAGIIMALSALNLLAEAGASPAATLLLVSEEEVGSPVSRPVTEALARKHRAVFVLEPPQGLAYKTARKGIADYTLSVTGVAAHSGVDFDHGHSAIRELARQIEILSALTGARPGLNVNVGVIEGGTRSNVVAAQASARIDVRISRAADAPWIHRQLQRLKPVDPHCTFIVTGGLNRPPMERKPGTVALFHHARKLAAQLGFLLEEASTGGGSDGNFTAALGVPTLDGMGAVGEGAHAPHESILRTHLAPRIALLAAMLATTS